MARITRDRSFWLRSTSTPSAGSCRRPRRQRKGQFCRLPAAAASQQPQGQQRQRRHSRRRPGCWERRSLPPCRLHLGAGSGPYVGALDAQTPRSTRFAARLMMRGAEKRSHHRSRGLRSRPRHLTGRRSACLSAPARSICRCCSTLTHSTFSRSKAISILRSPRRRADAAHASPGRSRALLDGGVADVPRPIRIAAASELADRFNAHVALKGLRHCRRHPGTATGRSTHRQSRNGQRRRATSSAASSSRCSPRAGRRRRRSRPAMRFGAPPTRSQAAHLWWRNRPHRRRNHPRGPPSAQPLDRRR